MIRRFYLLVSALAMLSAPVFAQDKCQSPVAPKVPDGKTANVAELVQTNKDVVGFIKASDDYQNCLLTEVAALEKEAKENKKSVDSSVRKALEAKGDANQKEKERVGKEYNTAAAAYKSAHPK